MTTPLSPQPPPGADITEAVRLGNEFQSHRTGILTLGIIIIALLFAWQLRERVLSGQIDRERHTAASLADSAKSNTAKAMFWQSEAAKHATAVTRDTLRVTRVIEGAPRFIYTDTGMRLVPLSAMPPAPPLDTALPGQKFGATVPYAVQPNTQFYTRTSDFDSLAVAAAQMHQDFEKQIAAIDSGLSHVELAYTEKSRETDSLAAENKAIRRAARFNLVKAGAIGVGIGVIIEAVLHR